MSIAIYRKSLDGKTASVDNGKRGVVEPNHLSAPRNGQVYASRPAADGITELENGMFVDYNVNGTVTLGGKYMVFNEEKLYDERLQSHRDFSQKTTDSTNGVIVPRVFGMVAGDTFTTNTLVDAADYAAGDYLIVNSDGLLTKTGATASNAFAAIVKEFTLPDGVTPAVQVQIL